MIRLTVTGAKGRMGACVIEHAGRDERFRVVAALDRDGDHALPECDVLIDFTDAVGTMEWLDVCGRRGIAMVVGATGHDEAQSARIAEAGRRIAIVKAANFSVGVNVLLDLVGKVAARLGAAYDIEIVETHHRHKVDAPSGTALSIADELQRSLPSRDAVVFGRHGRVGRRPAGEIVIHAVRMGEVIGKHEVHFGSAGETVTITHEAHSRDAFATGALRAAAWVAGKPPGLYSMRQVLELT